MKTFIIIVIIIIIITIIITIIIVDIFIIIKLKLPVMVDDFDTIYRLDFLFIELPALLFNLMVKFDLVTFVAIIESFYGLFMLKI